MDHPPLAEGLIRLHRGPAPCSDEADRAVRSAIREHFTAFSSRRRRRVGQMGGVAAAAVLMVAVAWMAVPQSVRRPGGSQLHVHREAAPSAMERVDRADLDENGRVDILDAFLLARRIEEGVALHTDLTGDQLVDRRDVDLIAMRAVALEGGAGG